MTFALLALVIGSIAALFLFFYRPWQLRWGATPGELSSGMPGDEVVPSPNFKATRAITIDAPPEAIWPWLIQIGFGRAGGYSYDVLDNLGRHNSEEVVPELQHIEIRDLIPLGPGKEAGMRVKDFDASEPGRSRASYVPGEEELPGSRRRGRVLAAVTAGAAVLSCGGRESTMEESNDESVCGRSDGRNRKGARAAPSCRGS